jgi:oligoribonuclease NrnB/cAMP/cGMP phosphodiesterase (DHH superfamily)
MQKVQILSHGDFDGIVSAALVGLWTGIDFVFFTGPENLRRNRIGEKDIVCDLPHPAVECRAWFDHHPGNIEEAEEMGWSAGEGAAVEAPSAARVIFDHLRETVTFPDFMADTVEATDRVDTMDYETIEDWLAPTPENVINATIFLSGEDMQQARRYMWRLIEMIQQHPLDEIAEMPAVNERYQRSQEHARRASETIEKVGELIAEDHIVLLDFSEMKVAPRFSKNLAYTVFPEATAVLQILPVMQGGRKTNDLRLSLSLNPFLGGPMDGHNVAEIMEKLELGGGHAAAAGGKITAESRDARLRIKADTVAKIAEMFGKQSE